LFGSALLFVSSELQIGREERKNKSMRPPAALVTVFVLCLFLVSTGGQQTATDDHKTIERAAGSAFAAAFRKEAGRGIKQVNIAYLREVCTADEFKRARWDGMYTFERVNYTNALELENKMSGLIRTWKVEGSSEIQHPRSLFPADFPNVKRYAVSSCGTANGTTTVVVAVFKSSWATYWENWGTILGK
jgi:hypothetical protein